MTSGISAHTIVYKRWMLLSDRLMIDNRHMDNTDYMNDNSKNKKWICMIRREKTMIISNRLIESKYLQNNDYIKSLHIIKKIIH